jgi:hypothetical protein
MLISEMITLFEAFDNKYMYDVIRVSIADSEHSRKIQELCFKYGFKWVHGWDTYFNISLGFYCIDICLRDDMLYLNPDGASLGSHNLPHWESLHYSVDPIVYQEQDFDTIESILNSYNQVVPSYKPKKFLKEGVEYAPYTEAYFKVNDKKEQDFVVDFLFKKGYKHFGGMRVDINTYPAYIFTRFMDKNISYLDDETDDGIDDYVKDYNATSDNVYEMNRINTKLFDYKDVLQLDSIERTGDLQVVPNYRPRRIDRTLEATEYWPYRFKTEKELLDE